MAMNVNNEPTPGRTSTINQGLEVINKNTTELDNIISAIGDRISTILTLSETLSENPSESCADGGTYPVNSELGAQIRDLGTNLGNSVERLRNLLYSIDL